ncbi:MAG: Disulfide bond formation protein B [Chlamydiae bacterium]|nr:Disulfide bond formation protein B [Chlamydiota bacterium]
MGQEHLKSRIQKFYAYVLFISIVALLASFSVQYIWSLQPCFLCKLQKFPYIVSAILCSIGLISPKIQSKMLLVLVTSFALGFCLSLYHVGIQHGLIKDRCAAKISIQDIDAFEQHLLSNKPCSQVSWSLFGFSISGLNAIVFFVGASSSLIIHRRIQALMNYKNTV